MFIHILGLAIKWQHSSLVVSWGKIVQNGGVANIFTFYSGGSHTEVVIVSENGEVVGQSEGEGTNPWVNVFFKIIILFKV